MSVSTATHRSPREGAVMRAVRRTHSLPVELLILTAVILVWQIARVPFEITVADAADRSRDWLNLERALGIAVEPGVLHWFAARREVLDPANWFYSHMDAALVMGGLTALRLIDPVRFAAIRTAFALAHIPAIAVVALLPLAPPRWVSGELGGAAPDFAIAGDLRNSTAAAVSLHVGMPVLVVAAAFWVRPRAPLTWLTPLYPALVSVVVVGTANHFVLDLLIGAACAAIGIAGARAIHGALPRSPAEARPAAIVAVAAAVGAVAFVVEGGLLWS